MATSTTKNHDQTSTEKKLDDLYELIEGIEIAMMTTRRPDGYLVSRPMATQKRENGSDLWFWTSTETHKLDELEFDPHVNIAFLKPGGQEWVSVSGTARLSKDRAKIQELYQLDWKAWIGDEGGARDGGPGDPRIVLIFVDAHTVVYQKKDRPLPAVLFDMVKGIVTGEPAKSGDLRHVSEAELRSGDSEARL